VEVIPAIDLLEGRCVRLYQGDYAQSQVFNEDPVAVAKEWVAQGATRLHLVDLDGAKKGEVVNRPVIAEIVRTVSVPVQVGGGLRDRDSVANLLALGVERAILGTVAVEQPQLVEQLCQEFAGHIAVGIDAREGMVATRGWLETSAVPAIELAQQMQEFGVAAIIYTDIQRDGTLQGPNVPALREMVNAVQVPVIASGGMSSMTDLLSLLALEGQGLSGVIIGRALYTGNISLKEALQAVGPERLQDVPPDFGSSAFA
jgi:phosphoribosylformimino-5-aminoimidazole carboxamide ribotide isomerase